MKKNDLFTLHLRLKALAVFRELLNDAVVNALCEYLKCAGSGDTLPAVSAYSEFVSKLYETGLADLGAHMKDITLNNENIYMQRVGSGSAPDTLLQKAVAEELKTLQMVAELDAEALLEGIGEHSFLPSFSSSNVDIPGSFAHRVENVSKYGYGLYAKNSMFYINADRRIVPVKSPDKITLDSLVDYERERQIIIDNTKALLSGKPAANILLSGDAGTGKSSTVKAVVNAFFADGLRIIEVRKEQLGEIPGILDELSVNPLKFILFIDDLSFSKDDDNFNALKAVLEGSVSAKSKNVVIYATSNRRHMVKEKFSDRDGDEIHRNDAMQEMISLSERFGIHVRFQKPDKKTFLHIVHHMAEEKKLQMDEEEIDLLAERFALERGGRSARLAKQFIDAMLIKTEQEN